MKALYPILFLSLSGFCFAQEKAPESEVRRIPIDPDRAEFDTDVHFANVTEDVGWAVWKGYRNGNEKIFARAILTNSTRQAKEFPVFEIADSNEGIFGLDLGAENLLHSERSLTARWSQRNPTGEWQIKQRKLPHPLSNALEIEPSRSFPGIRPQGDSAAQVWQQFTNPAQSSIQAESIHRDFTAEQKEVGIQLNNSSNICLHPVQTRLGHQFGWCFWDEYQNGEQWIAGCNTTSKPFKSIRISPAEANTRCLNPVAMETDHKSICVAWIKLTDVIGGDGVIDMIHTAHVATLGPKGEWSMVTDAQGSDEGAVMLNGLLPDLRKGKGYPSGYSGNRRKPMLLDAGEGGVWMIWERKTQHGGGGTRTAGQLLGRRFQKGKWVEGPLLLHEGLIDYRLASPRHVRPGGNTFFIVGSKIPHSWKRPSYLVEVDLRKARSIELDDWRDQFTPVSLPFPDEPERYSATPADGKKYQLFWGDLHCHSGLTGDAEGEPDEIVLYARDRAKLDVMVMQDNDEVHGRILTEGEYRMGATHSQWITEPGKFVALPGYEWTQRTSLKGVPRPYDSVHEQTIKGGFPNHRTVVYPIEGGPIVRFFEVGHQFNVMADRVQKAGGILHSQHPAFHLSEHPAETNLEVTACWGIYIRSVPALFHGELDKGRHMGFIGTSDSHRRNPGLCGGLTGIYAEDLSPEAIHRALKEHRVFATNGSKIVIDSRADDHFSDKVVKAKEGKVDLSMKVIGTRPITSVRLMGTGGKTLAKFQGDGSKEREFQFTAGDLKAGKHWFYWAIEQEGSSKQYSGNISVARGNLAWSSPHMVEVE